MSLAKQGQVGLGAGARGTGVLETSLFFLGFSLRNMSLECKLPGGRKFIYLFYSVMDPKSRMLLL